MSITSNRPDAPVYQRAADHIQQVASLPGSSFIDLASSDAPVLTSPLPVYAVEFDTLVTDLSFQGAVFVGWSLLVEQGSKVVARAVVHEPDGGVSLSLTSRRYPVSIAKAITKFEQSPRISTDTVDARILQVNSLQLLCLWLKGASDIVVPLRPAPAFLHAGEEYRAPKFFEALRVADPKPFGYRTAVESRPTSPEANATKQ